MQIHLSDISSGEGMRIQKTVEFGMDTISFQSGTFPVLAKEPIELTIVNTGDRNLEVTGTGKITVGIPCDRCLEEVSVEIPLEIERKLDMKLTDEDRVNDLDESSYLTGMDLDVDQLVYLELVHIQVHTCEIRTLVQIIHTVFIRKLHIKFSLNF